MSLMNFNFKNLVKSKKNRTFALDDVEPTALATDIGKGIPILTGEAARSFIEQANKVEEEARQRKNEPQSLESLKVKLAYKKTIYRFNEKQLNESKKEIQDIEHKIKALEEKLNG